MITRIEESIIAITEAFLPKFTEDKVLCISIDARLNYYGKKQVKGVIRGIHIAIYRPMNYTKVIMAVDSENIPAFTFDPSLTFKHMSDHDSCWRSDGLESPLNKVSHDMVNELEANGAPKLPYSQYTWDCTISEMKIVPGKILVDRNKDYKVTLEIDKSHLRLK